MRQIMPLIIPIFAILLAHELRAAQPAEVRQHLNVKDVRGAIVYTTTVITAAPESGDTLVLLVEDADGRRYIMTGDNSYSSHSATREIRSLDGKDYFRVTYKLPSAITKTADFRRLLLPASDSAEIIVTVDAGLGAISGPRGQWRSASSATWRRQLRESMSPVFLEALEMFGTCDFRHSGELSVFYAMVVEFVLHRVECPADNFVRAEAVTPDCKFDRAFARPCSAEQEELAKRAASSASGVMKY